MAAAGSVSRLTDQLPLESDNSVCVANRAVGLTESVIGLFSLYPAPLTVRVFGLLRSPVLGETVKPVT